MDSALDFWRPLSLTTDPCREVLLFYREYEIFEPSLDNSKPESRPVRSIELLRDRSTDESNRYGFPLFIDASKNYSIWDLRLEFFRDDTIDFLLLILWDEPRKTPVFDLVVDSNFPDYCVEVNNFSLLASKAASDYYLSMSNLELN